MMEIEPVYRRGLWINYENPDLNSFFLLIEMPESIENNYCTGATGLGRVVPEIRSPRQVAAFRGRLFSKIGTGTG